MNINLCRQCNRIFYDNCDYHGFCSVVCCVDFSIEHGTTFDEAKHLRDDNEELEKLKSENWDYESDYYSGMEKISDLEDKLEEANRRMSDLNNEITELKGLKWTEIKRERRREAAHNEIVINNMETIKRHSKELEDKNNTLEKENLLILHQNLDLLNTIKDMRSYSDRFQLIEFDIEPNYDE